LTPPAQALVPRWLVVAVIVMGLLLVIGSIVVGTEVSRRLSSPKPAASPAAEPGTLSTARPFTQRIELPAGAQVISMTAVGDRLVVQVENQAGLTSAYVVDPRTGALLGTIDFPPGAPR
jgi:hypothetical protein